MSMVNVNPPTIIIILERCICILFFSINFSPVIFLEFIKQ